MGLALLLLALAASGCRSHSPLASHSQRDLQEAHAGESYWLRQSMYVGDFYDDDRYQLMDARRFEELRYLHTLEGDVISPPPARGIIPAGTRVQVEDIAFPTGDEVWRRPLYSPRYSTWVRLRVARDRGDVTLAYPKPHILLIPAYLPDRAAFDAYFEALLSRDDPNPFLRQLPAEERAAVETKRARVGMTREALHMALGFADRMRSEHQERGDRKVLVEVAVYGATSVVLEEGVVVRVSEPGGLEVPAPAAGLPTGPAGAASP